MGIGGSPADIAAPRSERGMGMGMGMGMGVGASIATSVASVRTSRHMRLSSRR